jgi:hypothetical protein
MLGSDGPMSDGPISDGPMSDGPMSDGHGWSDPLARGYCPPRVQQVLSAHHTWADACYGWSDASHECLMRGLDGPM